MKKNKLFLVVLLSWLSLSSIVITNATAHKIPVTEKSFTVLPQSIGKFSIKGNNDYTIYFTLNITSLSESPANVTMIMFKAVIWENHSGDLEYLYNHSVYTVENLTDTEVEEDFYELEYFFYEDDKFYPGFINMATYSWVQIDVIIEKEERSRMAYYFAGFVSVIFAGLIFWVIKKKRDLLGERAEEIPQDAPLDSVNS